MPKSSMTLDLSRYVNRDTLFVAISACATQYLSRYLNSVSKEQRTCLKSPMKLSWNDCLA